MVRPWRASSNGKECPNLRRGKTHDKVCLGRSYLSGYTPKQLIEPDASIAIFS